MSVALYASNGEEIPERRAGYAIFAATLSVFAQPAVGAATVALSVDNVEPFFPGCPVTCVGGSYTIGAVTGDTVTMINIGAPNNVAVGANVALAGLHLWPTGFMGALQVGSGTMVAGSSGAIASRGTASSVYAIQWPNNTNAGNIAITAGAGTFQVDDSNAADVRTFRWALLSP